MAFVIDGSNLLGQMAPGGHRDAEARARLVAGLLTFQRLSRSRILLVFDGPPDARFEEGRLGEKFHVLFPPPGEKADGLIQGVLERSRDRRRFQLVTSDRELRTFARSRGLSVLTAQEFARRLKSTLRQGRKERELAKPNPSLTPLETRIWSDLFKKGKR